MSQIIFLGTGGGPTPGVVLTLTGNNPVAVPPDGLGNINIINANTTVDITGNAGTNTLTQDFGISNLILGDDATALTTGTDNVGVGLGVFANATTAQDSVVIGSGSGAALTTGSFNVFAGRQAGAAITVGQVNTLVGSTALAAATGATANNNTVIGGEALFQATTSLQNTVVGAQIGTATLDAGQNNTIVGYGAAAFADASSDNVIIGAFSGNNYSAGESDNILINNAGVAADANTIRIGTQGSGTAQQDTCFIAGIANVTVSNQEMVVIDTTTGQLGSEPIGTGAVLTLTGDAGGPVSPVAGNIDVPGDRNMNTLGNSVPGELQVRMNNNISLGDLSTITTDNDAITIVSGDITFQATGANAAGNIVMPETSLGASGRFGVLNYVDFIGTQRRFLHCFGGDSPTSNTFVGLDAGNFTVNAQGTVGVGYRALTSGTLSQFNTAVGNVAGQLLTTGGNNTMIGSGAGGSATTASSCTLVGNQAGAFLVNGAAVDAFGTRAATTYTGSESNNLCISNFGIVGDNNTIRIGRVTSGASPFLAHTSTYIAGIAGVTVSNAELVTIDTTTGQLGSTPSTSFTWSVVTGASQAMAVNNGYIANNAGTINFSLPATSAVGSVIRVTGINNATGWQITQAAGQQIFFGATSTTLGVGGSLTSSATRDSVEIVCVVADTTWNVISSIGNITVV